jgi:hypothetical protein
MARRGGIEVRLVYDHMPTISRSARYKASQIVRDTAFSILLLARHAMMGPKHGKVYQKPGRVHQASAPGEAPAIDLGNLINSLNVEIVSDLTARVTVGAEYGSPLEFGTVDGRVAPRPFLRPAAAQVRAAFFRAIREVVHE